MCLVKTLLNVLRELSLLAVNNLKLTLIISVPGIEKYLFFFFFILFYTRVYTRVPIQF